MKGSGLPPIVATSTVPGPSDLARAAHGPRPDPPVQIEPMPTHVIGRPKRRRDHTPVEKGKRGTHEYEGKRPKGTDFGDAKSTKKFTWPHIMSWPEPCNSKQSRSSPGRPRQGGGGNAPRAFVRHTHPWAKLRRERADQWHTLNTHFSMAACSQNEKIGQRTHQFENTHGGDNHVRPTFLSTL